MLFSAVAWACTQRVGTFLVCRPPSQTYVSGQCGSVTGVSQTGTPSVLKAGSIFSGKATNFLSKPYTVNFVNVGVPASTSCHVVASGVTQLRAVDASGNPIPGSAGVQFMGPSWYKSFKSPSQTATGAAKVCTQDSPGRVSGQVINLSVI